jgi:hypothetical protein
VDMTYILRQITLVKELERETAGAVSNDCHFIMSSFKDVSHRLLIAQDFFRYEVRARGGGVIERGVTLGQVLLQVFGFTAINYHYSSAPYSIT